MEDMADLIVLGVSLLFAVFMLGLGFFVGGWRERVHLESLSDRELQNHDFLITQVKSYPDVNPHASAPKMFIGEAVIGSDYLKTFLGGLRNFFGGEVRSYQTLMDRARREALQRIVEQARAEGYNAICNVRMQTADVGGNNVTANNKKKAMVMSSILASATAYHRIGS